MNILDSPDLRSGEHYGTYAYRLLDRKSTRQLRLMEIHWTGNQNPHDEPRNITRQVMEKVGTSTYFTRWPLITRVWRALDGKIIVFVENQPQQFSLVDGDQIMVEVA